MIDEDLTEEELLEHMEITYKFNKLIHSLSNKNREIIMDYIINSKLILCKAFNKRTKKILEEFK